MDTGNSEVTQSSLFTNFSTLLEAELIQLEDQVAIVRSVLTSLKDGSSSNSSNSELIIAVSQFDHFFTSRVRPILAQLQRSGIT